MKKTIVFVILVLIIVLTGVLVSISDNNKKKAEILEYNAQFNKYER